VKQDDPHARRLPAQQAFVVQLRATADVAQGCLEGRVEHVVSGQATQFHTLAELLALWQRGRTPGSAGCREVPAGGRSEGTAPGGRTRPVEKAV
jgi:hypothetical protein